MRRADRLFQIVQFLRGRRLTTAAFLAGRLGVSLRTVYRDVRDLSLSGVPVEGEAGVGYRLRAGFDVDGRAMRQLESVREAIGSRRVLRLDYRDAGGKPSARDVWPLALYYWGRTWTIGAWCERRTDFRNFRVDRIAGLEMLDRRYPDEAGKRLADFIRAMEAR